MVEYRIGGEEGNVLGTEWGLPGVGRRCHEGMETAGGIVEKSNKVGPYVCCKEACYQQGESLEFGRGMKEECADRCA